MSFKAVKLSGYSCQEIVDAPVNVSLEHQGISPVTHPAVEIWVRHHLNTSLEEIVPEDGIFSGRFEAVGKQDAGEESPKDPKKERRVKSGPVSRPVFLSLHLSELHNPGFVISQILLATILQGTPGDGGESRDRTAT